MRANDTPGLRNMIWKVGAFCGICIAIGVTDVHVLVLGIHRGMRPLVVRVFGVLGFVQSLGEGTT